MKDPKQDPDFKSMTLKIGVYKDFERLKKAEEAALGVSDLSWTDFVGIVVKRLKRSPSKRD